MIRFEDILDKVETYKPDFDEELLQKAYIFSAREHRGQVRSSGEPYLVHPLNVAYILADMRLDETSIAVGLLHDVLEDTLTTKETLQEISATRWPSWSTASPRSRATRTSRRKSSRPRRSARCCWRWSATSASSWSSSPIASTTCALSQYLPEERRLAVAKETMEIYAPIANRLGMGRIKPSSKIFVPLPPPREFEELHRR